MAIDLAETDDLPPATGRLRAVLESMLEDIRGQRDRLILWVPVWVACGIGWYFALPFEPPAILGAGMGMLCLILWALSWPLRHAGGRGYAAWLCAGIVAAVATGFCAAQIRTTLVDAPMLARETGPADVQGRVVAIDRLEEGAGLRLTLGDVSIERLAPALTPKLVRIKIREGGDTVLPSVGDRIAVLADLKPPSPPAMPGAFDFQRHAYFMELGAQGFAYRAPVILDEGRPEGYTQIIETLREAAQRRIEAAMDGPQAGIAKALMTGERAGITTADWDAMRASGLAHMISISGLHIGIVAAFVFFSTRFLMALAPPLALRLPIKKYAALLALAAIIGYALIVEFSVPTWRSVIMTGIVLAAVMIDRVAISLRLLALAATAVLVFVPDSLTGASFQMSFAAVTALVFFYEQQRDRLAMFYRDAGAFRKIILYVSGVCLTTIIATLATAPFSLFHFQQLAVYSLLANALAMPPMTFIVMPAAVIAYLLMPFGLESVPLFVMGKGIALVSATAHAVAVLPLSTWTPPVFPFAAFMCLVCAGLFAVLWRGRGRIIAAIPVVVAIVLTVAHTPPALLVSDNAKLAAVYDGQGGLWLTGMRGEKFTAEIWARSMGLSPEEIAGKWQDNPAMACDPEGCRVILSGRRIALSMAGSGSAEDCGWADILLLLDSVKDRDCRAATVIDRRDIAANGAYAVWLDGKMKSVAAERGRRPWSRIPASGTQ